MSGTTRDERRLKLACEISPDRVIAARTSDAGGTLDSCSIRTLAPGALTPALATTNVTDRNALAVAVSDVLSAVGGRHRDIIAVIPDGACRIALLDFETLPDKAQDADAVVRFRLKKSLPFDVERAKISYDVRRFNGSVHAVAVVALPAVLDEYESVLRSAGFNPGVVLPSSLASLGLVDASRPTLLVKVAAKSVSLAIVHNDALLLFRTLESESLDATQLAEDIYPSLVFFQDTYGTKLDRVLLDGATSKDLAPAIENSTGIRVQELVDTSVTVTGVTGAQRPFVGGILGALIS